MVNSADNKMMKVLDTPAAIKMDLFKYLGKYGMEIICPKVLDKHGNMEWMRQPWYSIGLDKSGYQVNSFFISQWKHIVGTY